MDNSNIVWRTLGLGAIAGVRSMAAPAALSKAVERGDVGGLEQTPFAALGSPGVSTVLRLFEIGEMFVDKLPVAPRRTSPPPLLGRAVSGAFVGAALVVSDGRRAAVGGALGAALENDRAVREAAYGYRPDARTQAMQRQPPGAEADGVARG